MSCSRPWEECQRPAKCTNYSPFCSLFVILCFPASLVLENSCLACNHLPWVSGAEVMIQHSHFDQIDQICSSPAPTTCAIVNISWSVYPGCLQTELSSLGGYTEYKFYFSFLTLVSGQSLSVGNPTHPLILAFQLELWKHRYGTIGKYIIANKINLYNFWKLDPILGSSICQIYVLVNHTNYLACIYTLNTASIGI